MRNFGIEYEFFVGDPADNLVAAHIATNNLDGNPVIGEIRTEIHSNVVDLVFDLQKKIYEESSRLTKKGFKILDEVNTVKVNDDFLKTLRANHTLNKVYSPLTEFSVYDKPKTGKILPRGVFKSSLQINFSENTKHERKFKKKAPVEVFTSSDVFDYYTPIRKLDSLFVTDIHVSGRVPGVYAIKDGRFGKRIEYRSLPSTISFQALLSALEQVFGS